MGGKYPRQRKYILLYLACWLSLSFVFAGCAPLYSQYNEKWGTYEQRTEARQLLLQAKSSFTKEDFLVSFNKSREILTRFPQTYGDRALYMMGLIYADPEYLYANYEISIHYLDKLIKKYPESALKNNAKILIGLLKQNIDFEQKMDKKDKQITLLKNETGSQKKQIGNLLNQLKQLKEIDLGIEEKKRESLPKIGK